MPDDLATRILNGDRRALARAISSVEDDPFSVEGLLRRLFPRTGKAVVVGVTGPPGSGKSSLIEGLARRMLSNGRRVGIVAVDPSSPFSGGAVLGDRVRMQPLATDPGVFIRSMATRGRLGGLSAAVRETVTLLDAAGYDRILLETVGVGQDEVDVFGASHITLVVLVPGMGDGIQAIKAGIMEIADVFVVNKADREGAERLMQQLQTLVSTGRGPRGGKTRIVSTEAVTGRGIDELLLVLEEEAHADDEATRRRRVESEKARLLELAGERVLRDIRQRLTDHELEELAGRIVDRVLNPYSVIEKLVGPGVEFGTTRKSTPDR